MRSLERKIAYLAAALVCVCPAMSLAGVVVSLNNPGSTTLHEIEVAPGSTFSVDVNLGATSSLYQLICRISANESNVFEITRLTGYAPWSGYNGVGPLGPVSSRLDWVLPPPSYFGPGTCGLGTLDFTVSSTAQGSYQLELSTVSYASSRQLGDYRSGTAGPSLIVHVVPEPASGLLILVACVFLRRPRKR